MDAAPPLPPPSDDFFLRLRLARRHAGLSQRELADQLGVSRNAVTHWERGGTVPTQPHLVELARVTGVSLEWLGTGRGRMRYQPGDQRDDAAMLLRYSAQDETEERILLGLRRLSYGQVLAVAALVEALGAEALAREAALTPQQRRMRRAASGPDAG